MIEIKEGPELNRAVAAAIGFRRVIQVGPKPDFSKSFGLFHDLPPAELVEIGADDPRMPAAIIPKYSTDLNAAFAAAEKAGMFNDWGLGLFGQWEVMSEADHIAGRKTLATGATPALAICAAILKEVERR